MNNLIGEFGPSLAQSRINDYLREAERMRLVSSALKERSALQAARTREAAVGRGWRQVVHLAAAALHTLIS
jgi:hypothetical protein